MKTIICRQYGSPGEVLELAGIDKPVVRVNASGGVGTFAEQLAANLGAEVTGVGSTRNVDMVRSVGADYVIDYTQEDHTDRGQRYDLIFELAAIRSGSDCRPSLTSTGTLSWADSQAAAGSDLWAASSQRSCCPRS